VLLPAYGLMEADQQSLLVRIKERAAEAAL
jgi:hypothetical protein